MASDLVTIPEFLRLTKLSANDLLNMLQNGELQFSPGPTRELLIDLTHLSAIDLATRSSATPAGFTPEQQELIEEIVASEVLNSLDEIVNEAADLALRWVSKDSA